MKMNVFGKKGISKDGRAFMTYLGKLTKKSGEEVTVQVKFREEVGNPKNVPCVIEFDKSAANYTEKNVTYVDQEGLEQVATRKTIWISGSYKESEFIDTSMDDFE